MGFPRIVYNNKHIDFSVPLRVGTGWDKFANVTSDQSGSGITEVYEKFHQHFPVFRLENETTDITQYLDDFYDYAQDGSTFDIVMDRDFGAYYAFNNNVRSNDGTLATFTRALTTDSSYYVDPDTGLLTVVNTVNVPRFPAGQFSRGLLIEGARTNLIAFPSTFDDASWTGSATVTDDNTLETLDPSGANLSDIVTAAFASEDLIWGSSVAVGNDATVSIRAKSSSGNVSFVLQVIGSTSGLSSSSTLTATPTWQRFQWTVDTSSGFTGNLQWGLQFSIASSLYLYGSQMEDSATFASENIGTTSTASVARSADLLLNTSAANILNREKMTIMFWFKPQYTAGSQGSTKTLFQSGASTANGHIRLAYLNTTANLFFEAFQNNSTTVAQGFDSSAGYVIQDTWVHLALTVDSTTGALLLYANGVLVETDSNDPFNISDTGDQFAIGSNIDGTSPAHGVFTDFTIFKNIKTATEILQYFNQTRGLGFRNNRMTCRLRDKSRRPQYGNGERFNLTIPFEEVIS